MKRGYFVRLVSGILAPPRGTRFAEDGALFRGGFAEYLRGLGFSAFTVEHYLRRLMGLSSQTAMAQQQLNGAHVRSRFEQVGCKTVPKRMRCDRFGNAATLMRLLAG